MVCSGAEFLVLFILVSRVPDLRAGILPSRLVARVLATGATLRLFTVPLECGCRAEKYPATLTGEGVPFQMGAVMIFVDIVSVSIYMDSCIEVCQLTL